MNKKWTDCPKWERQSWPPGWRWKKCYALLPTLTNDYGWIWLREYWKFQHRYPDYEPPGVRVGYMIVTKSKWTSPLAKYALDPDIGL